MANTNNRRSVSDNALHIYKKRYFDEGETSVEQVFHRVSGGDKDFYTIMENGWFLPNSPTLMNAGTRHEGNSTFSACFKFDVADSMLEGEDCIIDTAKKAAAVAKWGGGVGYYLGNLRGKGCPIRTVHRVACGPINVLKWYNGVGTNLITQGGRRELAQMGILPVDHPDIREFIHVKDQDPQALRTFNISVSITDDFMRKVMSGELGASVGLWNEIIDSAWKTGDPGLYFFDVSERTNPTPHLGQLTGTNPCGEVPLLNNEACNLGSISLRHFVTVNRTIDWNNLEYVVRAATRFLDNILDRNSFPHPAITKQVALTRKLGLGICGWAEMLGLLHIHYDSNEAVQLADKLMKFINEIALDESLKLAKLKGPYPGYKQGPEARNSTRTCLAPTGTIAILMDCDSGGCEPFFAIEWDRVLNAGVKEKEERIKERIRVIDQLEGFRPHIANEIACEWHIKHQAAFQQHTDLAVSKTINLPNNATRDDVDKAYKLMWQLGCKGGTIFRDGCRSGGEQVLYATKEKEDKKTFVMNTEKPVTPAPVADKKAGVTHAPKPTKRRRPPEERDAKVHHIIIGDFEGYVIPGLYDDGSLCEVFIKSMEGSTITGLIDSWAIAFSFALQHGTPLESLVKKYTGLRFEPNGMTSNKELPVCSSVIDYIVRYLDRKFGKGRDDAEYKGEIVKSGSYCPTCHAMATYQGGCLTCTNRECGWSKCG